MLRINFSWKTTIICLILASLMIRASFWQWSRHQQKLIQIEELEQRLSESPVPLQAIQNLPPTDLPYRRVILEGTYDFTKQVFLKNRKQDKEPGKHLLSPLKLINQDQYILVNRGFIPLALAKDPESFQGPKNVKITALLKLDKHKYHWLAPKEEQVSSGTNRKNWLRINLEELQSQWKLNLLDFYAEKIELTAITSSEDLISSSSDKADMLILPGTEDRVTTGTPDSTLSYPIPAPNKLLSAGRHLGYVYEWAFMATLTLLIGFVIQLRRH